MSRIRVCQGFLSNEPANSRYWRNRPKGKQNDQEHLKDHFQQRKSYRLVFSADQKLKKDGSGAAPSFSLVENPDILKTLSRPADTRPALVVGFAAETEKLLEHARAKRKRKGCDWMVANDVSAGVMGAEENTVHILRGEEVETWPTLAKDEVARRLAALIAEHLARD